MLNYLDYIWLIPTLPLAGFVLIGLLGLITLRSTGAKLNKKLVSALALGSVGLSFLLSVLCVYQLFWVQRGELFLKDLFTWVMIYGIGGHGKLLLVMVQLILTMTIFVGENKPV